MPFDGIAYVLVGYPAEVVNTKEQMLYHYGDEEAASTAELIPTLYTPETRQTVESRAAVPTIMSKRLVPVRQNKEGK